MRCCFVPVTNASCVRYVAAGPSSCFSLLGVLVCFLVFCLYIYLTLFILFIWDLIILPLFLLLLLLLLLLACFRGNSGFFFFFVLQTDSDLRQFAVLSHC